MATTTQVSSLGRSQFYLYMSLSLLATAIIGFFNTYIQPLALGTFKGQTILHIHGAVFFGWFIFYAVQNWLVASGRTRIHREVGLLGIALATAMFFTVMITTTVRINYFEALGFGEQIRIFSWVQVGGILFFISLFTLAILSIRNPETHKRLMLLATISLMDAPIARILAVFLLPPPPPGFIGPPPVMAAVIGGLGACVFLIWAVIHDWRTRGRPHSVYLYGGAAFILLQLTRIPISETGMWMKISTMIGNLGH
ncbi:hypothetical protein ABFZ85_10270 [Hyphococcus formosus]|uniref:hypothetical protein n=1 Tax=Hyphococcus formosus TaxID=3143534 RepID=UPI00398AE98A